LTTIDDEEEVINLYRKHSTQQIDDEIEQVKEWIEQNNSAVKKLDNEYVILQGKLEELFAKKKMQIANHT